MNLPKVPLVKNFKPNLAANKAIQRSGEQGISISPKGVIKPVAPKLNISAPKPSGSPLGGLNRRRRYYGEGLSQRSARAFGEMKGLG